MTLVVTHPFVSPKAQGGDSTRVYGPQWNANHTLTGTSDASQLNANVVQAVTNDTNIQGSIASQTLTFSWGGTLAAARLNANVVQAITNDTNVTGSITAQNLTLGWTGQLGLARGGTNADLSATGGAANYLKQASLGAAVTVGTIPASDIASGAALTKANDTNVTLTLGGTPATSLLAATSITAGWTGTLAASRGGFGSDVSASAGVPLFAAGVPTFTGTSGSGNFVRVTSPTLVTPLLGTPTSGTLTNCTGLPLTGLANQAAWTFLFNNTSGSAAPTANTIDGLTLKATPASTDEVIIWDIAGTAIKKATVSSIGSSSGVSSIAGNTGAFTLANGIDNSTNQIQLTAARRTLPTVQTLTSGSGATYTTPANCLWLEVWIVGGGGGGAGCTTTSLVAGTDGTASTFNSINANPGKGASATAAATALGGTAGTGTATRRVNGEIGGPSTINTATTLPMGRGGNSNFAFGAAPSPGSGVAVGTAGTANTGGGGSGANNNGSSVVNGGGGGGGETAYLIINSPSATYTYTVGGGGAGGVSTTNGGAGGSGVIFVIEHYGS